MQYYRFRLEPRSVRIQLEEISFIIPQLPVSATFADSTKEVCLLKADNGKISQGKYLADSKAFIVSKSLHVFTYAFNKDDLQQLSGVNITDIKFFTKTGEGGLYDVDRNSQDKISKLASLIISKIK